MLARLRERGSGESGSIMVLVAGMLVLIIAAAALAIDIGSFYKAQRQAQAAADAGALAAGQDVSTTAQSQDGTTYALQNYPNSRPIVTPNYNGKPGQVQVVVTANTPGFFGQFFGVSSVTVKASAIAADSGKAAPAAVFGDDSTCTGTGIQLNGQNATINGAAVSNGNLEEQTNQNSSIVTATYGGPNSSTCTTFTNNANGNSPGGTFSYGPAIDSKLEPWPVDYSTSGPACSVTSATPMVWSASGTQGNPIDIPAGVYCAPEIDITGNNIYGGPNSFCGQTCGVAFKAAKFVITGNNDTLIAPGGSPANQTSLLFWDDAPQPGVPVLPLVFGDPSNSTIGNSMSLVGNIYAPGTSVVIDGNSLSETGLIEANDVTVNGNSFSITGTGPMMGGNGEQLIQ